MMTLQEAIDRWTPKVAHEFISTLGDDTEVDINCVYT